MALDPSLPGPLALAIASEAPYKSKLSGTKTARWDRLIAALATARTLCARRGLKKLEEEGGRLRLGAL